MGINQREQLNRFLAERVLEWQFNQPAPKGFFCRSAPTMDAPVWIKKPDGWQCGLCDSIPDFTQWSDCEPLLNKIEQDGWVWKMGFVAFSNERWYWFEIEKNTMQYRPNFHETGQPSCTQALCLAIAKAYGWKEAV